MWQWWKRAGGEVDAEMKKEIAGKRKVLKRKVNDIKLPSPKEAQAAGTFRGPLRAKKRRELRADQAAARKWLDERRIAG